MPYSVAPIAPRALAGPRDEAASVIWLLVVQDATSDLDIIHGSFGALVDRVPDCVVECVDSIGRARERLVSERFDAVLLDLSLPDVNGVEGVEVLCAAAPDVPMVVMIGLADDGLAAAAVRAGAQDYVTKGYDTKRVVRHAVRHAIERHRQCHEREVLLAREREARAAAERAARARDDVLATVSHDLRSALSGIAMSANALLDGSGDPPQLAGAIARSSDWALRIIRDLLDVTAIEAGRLAIHREPMTVQAITEVISSMFASPAASAGVTLVVNWASAPLWIDADVDRVVQALGNLVGNAIKFTPRGGAVTLTVSRSDDAVRFRVDDTGPGIAPNDVPRLFDRYWQADASRQGGAGLGLPIARGIAERHGGQIQVESRLGHGSAFTLVLPGQP